MFHVRVIFLPNAATLLKEMVKMMVEISKTVDNEVGDGTTSSVVFGGALLEKGIAQKNQ